MAVNLNRIGPVFKHNEWQAFFNENGFVKLPLLTVAEVNQLKSFYELVKKEHEAIDIPFVSTSHSNNADLIARVNASILEVIQTPILKIVDNSEIIFSNFLLKKNGAETGTGAHQDLTMVDEQKYLSFSVWIPLEDTNPLNGCLKILAKSHKFDISIRPNSSSYWKYKKVSQLIERDMLSVHAKAGEAVIFSHATIHGSHPNLGRKHRLACVVSLYPKEATLYNYFLKENHILQKYEMNREAFIKYIKGGPPQFGKLMGETMFGAEEITEEIYKSEMKKVHAWNH